MPVRRRAVAGTLLGLLSCTAVPLAWASEPFPSGPGNEWAWVDVPGTQCINGKPSGVYVKPSLNASSRDVAIYLFGGGACFNYFTCATAASDNHPEAPGRGGQFSSTDKRNPYLNFHWIAVPYCTGDVHSGQNVETFEGKLRHFSGRGNLQAIMERTVATWPTLDNFAVTGESAGGFGAAVNYHFLRSFYPSPSTRGTLIDDSGPILDDQDLAVCLQQEWREHWNLNTTLPKDCPCVSPAGNMASYWPWLQQRWPNDGIGLISSTHDAIISAFFSFGNDDCKHSTPSFYDRISDGLKNLSANGLQVYMIFSLDHTHTGDKSLFYSIKVNGKLQSEWVGDLLAGRRPGSVVPAALPSTTTTPLPEPGQVVV